MKIKQHKYALLALLITFAGVSLLQAEDDVFVTEVTVEQGVASVTLNSALRINEIKVVKAEGRTSLRFPEYVSKSGRVFPQVTVHSKKVYDNILNAITSKKPSKVEAKSIRFRVGDPHLLKSPTRRANVEVTFNDAVSVTIGVMKSKRVGDNPWWIAYPSRRPEGGGKYIDQIKVVNKKLKNAVEDAVIKKFEKARSERGEGDDDK